MATTTTAIAVFTFTTTILDGVPATSLGSAIAFPLSTATATVRATSTIVASSAAQVLTSIVLQTVTIIAQSGSDSNEIASSRKERTGSIQHPNPEQIKTIWIAAVMLMALLLGWNMVILRDILYPWKMWVNVIHEGAHVFVGILTGAKVYSVAIDPEKGPISGMTGGLPMAILLSGYLGSILIGSAMVMCAFDISASKIAALSVYPGLIVCFWFGRTWARLRVLACIGISVAFFFIKHGYALRFYVLFLGVMNAFYVLWDVIDDRVFRKENESDVALMARLSPPTPHAWFLLWLVATLAFVALAIVGGLLLFDKSFEAQQAAQKTFLPT